MSRLAWPSPPNRAIVVRALRALWTLPTNLIGHAIGRVLAGGPGMRVGGDVVRAWAYVIAVPRWQWIGAITLGDVIVHAPGAFEEMPGRVLLAHELAHVRQHDVLGPFYLPAHLLAQLWSAARTGRGAALERRVHAYNPLEQDLICLGFDELGALARGEQMSAEERERFLQALGA